MMKACINVNAYQKIDCHFEVSIYYSVLHYIFISMLFDHVYIFM